MGPSVAVGAAVMVAVGEVLHVVLVRRKNPPMAGRWTLPGGRVERGERLVEAVRREVREETGLEVEVGALVEVFEVIEPGDGSAFHYVILDYVATVADASAMRAGDDAMEVALVPLRGGEARVDGVEVTEAVARVIAGARDRVLGR